MRTGADADYNPHMDVWVRKCASFEDERAADREFWARMTPAARIDVVEELRARWSSMRGDGHEGLRRTACVLERTVR